jgi:thiol-disulfide isomerase/thioredoxin
MPAMTARNTLPSTATTRTTRRGLLALSLAALLPLSLAPSDPAVAKVAQNAPAPNFTLNARGGQKLSLSQFKGQVVMINFWATWCGPCRQEMPLLDAMYQKYKRMGFTLIGVNVEPDSKAAEDFLKKVPVSFPIAFDPDSSVSKLYSVQGMPSSVIIDRKGNARVIHRGYKPGDENVYLDHIRKLFKE